MNSSMSCLPKSIQTWEIVENLNYDEKIILTIVLLKFKTRHDPNFRKLLLTHVYKH